MVDSDLLYLLCNALSSSDPELVALSLYSLDNLLEKDEEDEEDSFAARFESLGGKDKLLERAQHQNIEVYKQAESLLSKFFSSEECEEGTGTEKIN